ncbi:hypothetical protein F511_39505 [Dorcoceras hygrometricum]|uniref:Uncharacterized protein n=1 Tax=Dorcoceras hygrometricum TaxID=472368 RepID=A0A2Z7D066_9LAMI|nr:hypothetical protein F511_39505 [Dorcoceras hygrometricum]
MVKRLATSSHDPLGITDSACKNQSVMVSVQYGPFNTNIPIRSKTIGKSRVARDPITMHTSRRSNSDIACVTREHCDVLSIQMDSDLVIYRTTLVRTFQVVTICRVDKSEVRQLRSEQLVKCESAAGLCVFINGQRIPCRLITPKLVAPLGSGVTTCTKPAASLSQTSRRYSRRLRRAAADLRRKFVSGQFEEQNPFVQNSSELLVQPDEGVSVLVVDRIGDYLPQSTEKSRVLVIPVGVRHKCQQGIRFERPMYDDY